MSSNQFLETKIYLEKKIVELEKAFDAEGEKVTAARALYKAAIQQRKDAEKAVQEKSKLTDPVEKIIYKNYDKFSLASMRERKLERAQKIERKAREEVERLERIIGRIADDLRSKRGLLAMHPLVEPVSKPMVLSKEQKQKIAVKAQSEKNKPLIEIITALKKANQDFLPSPETLKKEGTKKQASAEFQHAEERGKELERLLRGAKTLSFDDLKSRLEEHLKTYQQQEIKDRAVGGGIFKGKVRKMLDTAEKSLKPLSPSKVSAARKP